jgi:hypothetical protein
MNIGFAIEVFPSGILAWNQIIARHIGCLVVDVEALSIACRCLSDWQLNNLIDVLVASHDTAADNADGQKGNNRG